MYKTNTQQDESELSQQKVKQEAKIKAKADPVEENDIDENYFYQYDDDDKKEQQGVIGTKGKGKKAKKIAMGGFW